MVLDMLDLDSYSTGATRWLRQRQYCQEDLTDMRDRARQRAMAEARSHRASAEELRDASKRVKELEQELLASVQLQPETKLGEDRRERYSRLLRLRALRDNFTSTRPIEVDHPNGFLMAIVMTVASLMICGFCAGGALVGLQVLSFKPSPIDAATAFWQSVEQQDYALIHSQYLSPTLRVVWDNTGDFDKMAEFSDSYYGRVTNFSLVSQAGDMIQTAQLSYKVTRNKSYTAILTLVLHGGSWGVDNLGSSLDPSVGGSLPAPPTPSPSPNPTPTSPTGDRYRPIWAPW